MADKAKSGVLDALKAGAVIVAADGLTSEPSRPMAPVETGSAAPAAPAAAPAPGDDSAAANAPGAATSFDFGGLEPDDAFGADPTVSRAEAGSERIAAGTGEPDRRSAPETGRKRAETRRLNAGVQATVTLSEKLLIGIHTMLANMLGSPHWEIEEDEAKRLSEAIGDLQAQYGVVLDAKTQAWVNLAMVGGAIYGPRVAAQALMSPAPKKQKQKPPEETVEVAPEPPEPTIRNTQPAQANGAWRPGFAPVVAPEITNPSQMYPPGFKGAGH